MSKPPAPVTGSHGPGAVRRRSGRLVLLVATALSGCVAPEPTRTALCHLADRTATAVSLSPDARPLSVPWVELGYDRRRAIVQHPPARYRFDGVPVSPDARLLVAPALLAANGEARSDGVDFLIRCTDDEGKATLLQQLTVSPGADETAQAWLDIEASLEACSRPYTSLELETGCGRAGDCRWDRAVWGEPRVEYEERSPTEVERLVLLISVDTLRPDRMSLYGATRPTTPEIEALAADAVVFEQALAPSPWTIPSHATLLTSTDPLRHGALAGSAIDPELPTLATVLGDSGWTAAGFVDTPWLAEHGFGRGYDHYDAGPAPGGSPRRGAASTRQRLLQWLSQAGGEVFVFWHVMDAHGPYGAPWPLAGRFRADLEISPDGRLDRLRRLAYHDYLQPDRFRSFDDLLAAYDEGVATVDLEIGRLLDDLRHAGLYEDALIVLTSDHGESFLDHGVWVGHGLFLSDAETRIPLIVKLPRNRFGGTRVSGMVRLIDVAATILGAVGVERPAIWEGIDLMRPRPGAAAAMPAASFAASSNTGARSVRTNGAKLISSWGFSRELVVERHLRPRAPGMPIEGLSENEAYYDLARDPREEHNRVRDPAAEKRVAELRRLLANHRQDIASARRPDGAIPGRTDLAAETVERLRALGYLGGPGS